MNPYEKSKPGNLENLKTLTDSVTERYKNFVIGQIHRTIARGKTVNLCFESTAARTVFEAEGGA